MFKKQDSEPPAVEAVYNRNASLPVAAAERFEIKVHHGNKQITIPIQPRERIGELIRKIAELERVQAHAFQLKYNDLILDPQLHLQEYGVWSDCEMHFVPINNNPLVRSRQELQPSSPSSSPSVGSASRLRSTTLPNRPGSGQVMRTAVHRTNTAADLRPPPILNEDVDAGGFEKVMLPRTNSSQLSQLVLELHMPPHLRSHSSRDLKVDSPRLRSSNSNNNNRSPLSSSAQRLGTEHIQQLSFDPEHPHSSSVSTPERAELESYHTEVTSNAHVLPPKSDDTPSTPMLHLLPPQFRERSFSLPQSGASTSSPDSSPGSSSSSFSSPPSPSTLRKNQMVSMLQVEFKFKRAIKGIKVKRSKAGFEIYESLRSKIPELADVPFYLSLGEMVIPDSKITLERIIEKAVPRVALAVNIGTPLNLHIKCRDQIWEYSHVPTMTTLILFQLVAQHFALPNAAFFLVCESRAISCDRTKEVRSLFNELPKQIDITVREEVEVILARETGPLSLVVPASSTIANLYEIAATQLGILVSSFYLSPDNIYLLPTNLDFSIVFFIQSTDVRFYLREASTSVKIIISGFDVEAVPMVFRRDAPIHEVWRIMDEHFPQVSAFVHGTLCSRRPVSYSAPGTHDLDKTPLSDLANDAGVLEIDVILREDAIFATVMYEDTPYPICAHPDLMIAEMFLAVLETSDSDHVTCFGPDSQRIDVEHPEWNQTIAEYLDNFESQVDIPVFHVENKIGHIPSFRSSRQDDQPIRLLDNVDPPASLPKEDNFLSMNFHQGQSDMLTVEVVFRDYSSPSLIFYEHKNTAISSLYMRIHARTNIPISSFLLSHARGLCLPQMSRKPIGELVKDAQHSLMLNFVTPKEKSYATLLPDLEPNLNNSQWLQGYKALLPPNPSLTNFIHLWVVEGERRIRINCFSWTNIKIVKDSVSHELFVPVEHQALIFNGRILRDDEKVFDMRDELQAAQQREHPAPAAQLALLGVVLVTDKSVVNALKFTAQFLRKDPPPLASGIPDHFSNPQLFYAYICSLPLDPATPWEVDKLTKFFKEAEARLNPFVKFAAQQRELRELNFNRLMAIYLWTSNILYQQVNQAILNEMISEPWHHFLIHFMAGIKALPPSMGTGYRGCKAMAVFNTYEVGKIVWWKNITGVSKEISQAKTFIPARTPGILFEVNYLSGRDISRLSRNPKEQEILLLPYSHFRVLEVKQNALYKVVKLQEVSVPTSLKVIFWVDDNPKYNYEFIYEAERRGISVVISRSTQEALDNLERYKWLLNLNEADFRIVTDMVRKEKEGGKEDHYAGLTLVQEIRQRCQYRYPIMIFCKHEEIAKRNCIQRQVREVYVTAARDMLFQFLDFTPRNDLLQGCMVLPQ